MRFWIAALAFACSAHAGEISQLWLTHRTNDPSKIVINWETPAPGNSIVEYGETSKLGQRVQVDESVTLHHVEIPLPGPGKAWSYQVHSGSDASIVVNCAGYPTEEFRVAVIGDTGYAKQPWAPAVLNEHPHLLISAGDHVPSLHQGQPVPVTDTEAFSRLIAQAPELFRTTPWMPLLGNHDREIRPRGPKPPPEPVYDIEATAFRAFFALPGDQWKWHFDVPDFGVRFIALDMCHLSDQGTTWQTCHPVIRGAAQYDWYRDLIAASHQPFVFTFDNERNVTVRGQAGGDWGKMLAGNSAVITGFGYFAERAEVDGVPYYNTAVSGTGTPYPDPKSAVLKSEDNFLLLTFRKSPVEVEIAMKNLHGDVLDRKTLSPRQTPH